MSIAINGTTRTTCSTCNGKITTTVKSALRVGRFFTGTMGEIIVFNRALNDEEADAVNDYLIRKWNIPN